jgi:hypothetical protein
MTATRSRPQEAREHHSNNHEGRTTMPARHTHKKPKHFVLLFLILILHCLPTITMSSSSPELSKPLLGANNNNNDSEELYKEEYKPAWLPAIVLFPPALPLFWTYHVAVNQQRLSFGYSNYLTCKKVDRKDIISAEPFEIKPLSQWGGWGIKLRFGKYQTGYIATGGPGVLLKIHNAKGKESVYVFSCQEPETVCEILNIMSTSISLTAAVNE